MTEQNLLYSPELENNPDKQEKDESSRKRMLLILILLLLWLLSLTATIVLGRYSHLTVKYAERTIDTIILSPEHSESSEMFFAGRALYSDGTPADVR